MKDQTIEAAKVAAVVAAAYEQGFAAGTARQEKADRVRDKISHKMYDAVIHDAIVAVGGEALYDQVSAVMADVKASKSSDMLSKLEEMLGMVGMGDDVGKLRELFRKETPQGSIGLYGLDLGSLGGDETVEPPTETNGTSPLADPLETPVQ